MIRFGLARVQGRSMQPTLHPGDRLLVAWGARPLRGRLVLCALPPDADGQPRPLSVKRLTGTAASLGLPEDGWWVERDNPAEGVDSWLVGPLPEDAVRAVVVCRLPRRPRWFRGRG